MKPEIWVAALLLAILLFVGVYDLVALVRPGGGRTVSEVIITWSQRWPILPFSLGLIIGHLFFPMTR